MSNDPELRSFGVLLEFDDVEINTRSSAVAWKAFASVVAACVAALAMATAPSVARLVITGSVLEWGFRAEPLRGVRMTLLAIDPGSELAAIGAKPGDTLELERQIDLRRRPEPGDSVTAVVRRADTATPVALRGTPREASAPERAAYVLAFVDLVVVLAFGLLVGLSRPHGLANRCLALIFITSAASLLANETFPAAVFLPAFTAQQALAGMAAGFLLIFGIYYPDDAPELRRRGFARFTPLWWLLSVAAAVSLVSQVFHGTSPSTTFGLVIFSAFLALFIVSMVRGLRASVGEHRQRFKWIFLSLGVAFGACVPTWVPGWEVAPIPLLLATCGILVGLIGLAYAVLRHHVLDFAFAVNRAIVYAALTGLLLLAFYAVEKGAEHYIHLEGETSNAFLDAAIGLALFLAVHKVKHRVDRSVERLLFREWHQREAHLESFTGSAIHFTRERSLCDAYAEALRSFAGGALVGVYVRDDKGDYKRQSGDEGLARSIDADHAVAVSLRASRAAAAGDAVRTLDACLALPFLSHDGIRGLVLLGARPPSGASYRPDEVRVLERSAHEVGMVLQTLEGERLKREVERLTQRLDAVMRPAISEL